VICFVARRRELPIGSPDDLDTFPSKTAGESIGLQILTVKRNGRVHSQHSII